MKNLKFILVLICAISLSCSNDVSIDFPNIPPGDNCITGEGLIISQTRALADINSITSNINANILLTQGPKEDIIIEGQQNILDLIQTEVVNNELIISQSRCVNILQAVKVYITIPDIRNLSLVGVGDFIAQNDLDLSELNVSLVGAGNFELKGSCSELDVNLTGAGDLKAFSLNTDNCNITISGVGDAEVFVNKDLNVTITGVGSVFYKGNPTIVSNITGSGAIVDAN